MFHTTRILFQSKQDRSKGLGLLLLFFCICLSYLAVYIRAVGQSALKLLCLRVTVLVPFLISWALYKHWLILRTFRVDKWTLHSFLLWVSVLDLAGMELTFSIAATMVPCFASVAKTVLITCQCFGYCWTALAQHQGFLPPPCPPLCGLGVGRLNQLIHLSVDLSSHSIPLLFSCASFVYLLECQHLEYMTVCSVVFRQSLEQQVPDLSLSKCTVAPNGCKSNTTFLLSFSRFSTFLTASCHIYLTTAHSILFLPG